MGYSLFLIGSPNRQFNPPWYDNPTDSKNISAHNSSCKNIKLQHVMRRQLQSVHDAHHTRNIYSRTMSSIQLAGILSLHTNTKDEHLGVKRGHSNIPSIPSSATHPKLCLQTEKYARHYSSASSLS